MNFSQGIDKDYFLDGTNQHLIKGIYGKKIQYGMNELVIAWHCTGGSDQDHPQEKEIEKGKMVVWGGLKNSWKEVKAKEKKKDIPIWIQSYKE